MELRVGTSGYSYKEWKGIFYPEKHPNDQMLAFYGERLSSVEINNTFYRMPKAGVLETWASQVPESFRFSVKASRRITHFKRLKDTEEETDYLCRTAATLGPKLGVLLFQLPPNLKKDVDRLRAFLEILPRKMPAAFEFRHETWVDDEVHELLAEHDRALCMADTDDGDDAAVVSTASWGYLRLRRDDYSDADLRRWADRVKSQDWSRAFVFFKHEDEAAGPKMAMKFLDLAG